jgi:hypothetical protein
VSWYNTVVLSFSPAEYEDEEDESCHDCAALRNVNAWLENQGYGKLSDLSSFKSGKLGGNAVLFGGCYNHLDLDAFYEVVEQQEWQYRDDVALLVWGDNDSTFKVYSIPAEPGGEQESVS